MAGKSFGVISPDAMFRSCIQAPYLPEYAGNMLTNYEESWAKANTWADIELIPEKCVKCPGLSICGGGCRTGCMWDNNGSVSGTTMYIGEALTTQQADVFKNRISHPVTDVSLAAKYEINMGIKLRKETFGTIVFNPTNQSFAIVDAELTHRYEPFTVADSKTMNILDGMNAIVEVLDKLAVVNEVKSIPGNILLPRMAQDLNAVDKYYCLRADTGERYYF
jgi:radical SAM protein with 4Fe4S-binding SPASM domain